MQACAPAKTGLFFAAVDIKRDTKFLGCVLHPTDAQKNGGGLHVNLIQFRTFSHCLLFSVTFYEAGGSQITLPFHTHMPLEIPGTKDPYALNPSHLT